MYDYEFDVKESGFCLHQELSRSLELTENLILLPKRKEGND